MAGIVGNIGALAARFFEDTMRHNLTETTQTQPFAMALRLVTCLGLVAGVAACSDTSTNSTNGNATADVDSGSGELDGADGKGPTGCYACHGTVENGNPAPPVGTGGELETVEPAVGAHQQHLAESTWHRTVDCEDCHKLPTSTKHSNGVVDYAWSTVATAMGSQPAFDPVSRTCSGAYCHGGTLFDAATAKVTPLWTLVDGTYNSCGQACHMTPPGGPHPKNTNCAQCHGAVIATFDPATEKATWKDATLHVNGEVNVVSGCTSCHGDPVTDNPAPPLGTKGETKTSELAVGAHTAHLASSDWHRQVACTDCHAVPTSPTHSNGVVDYAWGAVATAMGSAPTFDPKTATCSGAYCHGGTLFDAATAKTVPVWTKVDGTFNSCGQACHTTPPGGPHPKNNNCAQCHDAVIASFDPATQEATWKDATLHVDGKIEVKSMDCTSCHGDPATNNPAPPLGTKGETKTTELAVGAHAQHLAASPWHRQVACTDCHAVPASAPHANGVVDYAWSAVSTAMGSAPSFDPGTATCSGAYCHGGKLFDAATAKTKPVWTQVDGTFNSCGQSCHMTPPGGPHPKNTNCVECHDAVIATFDPATQKATWKDATLHVNGQIDVKSLTCTTCHGNPATNNPAPPLGTKGETKTTELAVGAHAQHLATSTWHRQVACTDCHDVPSSSAHANGIIDYAWSAVSTAMGSSPKFDAASATCSGAYCHGGSLPDVSAAKTVPVWTQVEGTFNSCGQACHNTPPGGQHPKSTNCAECHDAVIAAFDPATQKATWKDASLHINGQIDVKNLSCTTCHGDAATNNPAPPTGTKGETKTTDLAVGAHAQHLAASGWHRQVACTDCHAVPASPSHSNGTVDFLWGTVSTALGSSPAFDATTATCSGAYCHGGSLPDVSNAQTVPKWTQVDGTFNACGASCHTTPPGGKHPQNNNCAMCHSAVIASVAAGIATPTWANPALHIDGVIQQGNYHGLTGWVSPKFEATGLPSKNHHGYGYFIVNQGKDDKGTACTQCHGADYSGGSVGISCNDSTINCHGANPAGGTGGDWKSCNFCHGGATQNNPAAGVANESTNQTLAVGRHGPHLTASNTHVAFDCTKCHVVPAAGDISHIAQYVPSADLTTPGHHGDVTFLPPPTAVNNTGAMTWNVNATLGNPVTARGTCAGACHSNGRGGPPAVTPEWAGGPWNVGSCSSCHAATPNTGSHGDHLGGGNNVPCSNCHPGAAADTHVNGLRDVYATISGTPFTGGVTMNRPTTGNCANKPQCNGTCHGETHSNNCW